MGDTEVCRTGSVTCVQRAFGGDTVPVMSREDTDLKGGPFEVCGDAI